MDKCICDYLRLLDIEPSGYFVRLINTSRRQSIDLSDVNVQQRICDHSLTRVDRVLHAYRFSGEVRSIVPPGQSVTIYTRDYSPVQFEIRPYMFIADEIARWSVDHRCPIELSINELVFDRYRPSLPSDSDVPLLFISRIVPLRSFPTRLVSDGITRRSSCHFPYALPVDSIYHPHTSAASDSTTGRRKIFTREESSQVVKSFDFYPRRLTTAPTRCRRYENGRTSFAS